MNILSYIRGFIPSKRHEIVPVTTPKRIVGGIMGIVREINKDEERAGSVTWSEAADALLYVKQHIAKHRPATITNYKWAVSSIRRRAPWFAEMMICDITVNDYIAALKESFNTPTQYEYNRRILGCIFSHAVKVGWSKINPNRAIYNKKIEEKEIAALTPDQVKNLFAACRVPTEEEMAKPNRRRIGIMGAKCDLRDCVAPLALMAFGGVRPEEVRRLAWDSVNFEEGVISIRSRSSKTGGTRHVTMCAAMRAWLEASPVKEGNICPAGWIYRWAGIRHRAGWDSRLNPWPEDSLRHTFATYHLKTHRNVHQLQVEMGHGNAILIWQRYTNMKGVTQQAADEFWAITPDDVGYSG